MPIDLLLNFLARKLLFRYYISMFSRFTEKAIQTIMLAQEEAKKFHHSYVGTEHILLGIFNEGDNLVITILVDLGFNIDQVKKCSRRKIRIWGPYL